MSNPYFAKLGLRSSQGGLGVFVHEWVPQGTRILEFTGKRLGRGAVERALARNYPDGFLQVNENEFIGTSGRMDDYVNHSCNPNCGLEFNEGHIYLKAIKDISFGNEIAFDYATSQSDFPFRFICHCGDHGCRHEISDFSQLPDSRKSFYISKGVVAPYLLLEQRHFQTRPRTKYQNRPRKPANTGLVRH